MKFHHGDDYLVNLVSGWQSHPESLKFKHTLIGSFTSPHSVLASFSTKASLVEMTNIASSRLYLLYPVDNSH